MPEGKGSAQGEIHQTPPLENAVKPEQTETLPPDLIQAIIEARRYDRVDSSDPQFTTDMMKGGLESAQRIITHYSNGSKKTAEDWALYFATKGTIPFVGDYLELARTKPQIGGTIPREKMYALLSLAYERQIPFVDFSLKIIHASGKELPPEDLNEQLDQRNFLKQQSEAYRQQTGEIAYREIIDRANSPQFARYAPQIGHTLNPQFVKGK